MTIHQEPAMRARVLGPTDGQVAGELEFRTDRFLIDSADTGGRLAVVEHTVAPPVLAGPLHHHPARRVPLRARGPAGGAPR
jgi:hypothetical protein